MQRSRVSRDRHQPMAKRKAPRSRRTESETGLNSFVILDTPFSVNPSPNARIQEIGAALCPCAAVSNL